MSYRSDVNWSASGAASGDQARKDRIQTIRILLGEQVLERRLGAYSSSSLYHSARISPSPRPEIRSVRFVSGLSSGERAAMNASF